MISIKSMIEPPVPTKQGRPRGPTDRFATAKRARLGPADMGKLMKVSRVTASLWFNGHATPHHLLEKRMARILAAVKAAMQAGDLPVPYDVSRRERGLFITKIIVKHLKKMKRATPDPVS